MQPFFRKLNEVEELEYRQWARDNYKKHDPIKGVWHPVIQDECCKINGSSSLWDIIKENE